MPDHGHAPKLTPFKRLDSLDGLRSVAVLLVFAHHIDQDALPGGFLGVDLFFVISGFLITFLLLQERKTAGRISLSRFYIRRTLRLYPALAVLVLVVTPVAMVYKVGHPVPDGLATLAYFSNFWANIFPHSSWLLHTWSLAVEEQFYLVWPILLISMLRFRVAVKPLLICAMVLSLPLTYALHYANFNRLQLLGFLPTSHLPSLAGGVLLALAVSTGVKGQMIRFTGLHITLAAFVALLVALFVLPGEWWSFPLSVVVCWPPVAHVVLHRASWISALLELKPFVWLGQRSYGFYLWHYPVILWLKQQDHLGIGMTTLIALCLTLALTVASWRYVEKPFLRMKNRFEPPRDDRQQDF